MTTVPVLMPNDVQGRLLVCWAAWTAEEVQRLAACGLTTTMPPSSTTRGCNAMARLAFSRDL
jgi:tetrahydromethanopterin S-methyltransferase subunit C